MCGIPLAEERKKRKTFSSHMAGSLGIGVQEGGGGGAVRTRVSLGFTFFFLPSAIA